MRIRLSDEDRKRFDCPEWLEIKPTLVTSKEAWAIQQVLGFDDSQQVIEAWDGQFHKDAEGNVTGHKWDYDVWDAVVWLGLRHAGCLPAKSRDEMRAELAGIEYRVEWVRLEASEEPGKAQTSSSTPTTT